MENLNFIGGGVKAYPELEPEQRPPSETAKAEHIGGFFEKLAAGNAEVIQPFVDEGILKIDFVTLP